MAIFSDVQNVVKNKTTVLYMPVNSKGSQNKKQTYQYITAFDDKFFAMVIYSGHGNNAGNEDGILFMDIIIHFNIFLIKVITD